MGSLHRELRSMGRSLATDVQGEPAVYECPVTAVPQGVATSYAIRVRPGQWTDGDDTEQVGRLNRRRREVGIILSQSIDGVATTIPVVRDGRLTFDDEAWLVIDILQADPDYVRVLVEAMRVSDLINPRGKRYVGRSERPQVEE